MMKYFKVILLVIILFLLPSCESLVNSLSFYPDTGFILKNGELPSYIKPFTLTTDDGVNLEGLYFQHKIRTSRIVIYYHGNAGNVYHIINEASVIYKMGYDIIALDYRGYGKSTGKPSEKGVYTDGRTLLNYVTGTLNYDPINVFIYGRSIGTTVAVDVSQNIELGGVILITPLSSGAEFLNIRSPRIFAFIRSDHFNSIAKINNLKSPVLIIHGTADEVIPYKLGVRLYEAYRGEKLFTMIPGGGHNNLEKKDPELYWGSVKAFLGRK